MKTKLLLFFTVITLILWGGNIKAQSDGTLDTSFSIGTGFNGGVLAIAVQGDGKILVGGAFTNYNGTSLNRIARLNTDGSLDSSFNIGTGFADNVKTIVIQPDGKILVGGEFQKYNNGPFRNGIVRLNTDGSQDTSFGSSFAGFNGDVRTIALQSDGKILIGGGLWKPNGTAWGLLRLNTDGSVDTLGTGTSGFNGAVNAIILQPDGKIIVGGKMSTYNGASVNSIVRLNTNGSVDNTFFINGGFHKDVATLALQPDGKVLAGGDFTKSFGAPADYIVRLTPNGTLEPFIIGASFSGDNYADVRTLAVQKDGKILVGGNFTNFKTTRTDGIARLNINGTLDTSFVIGTGFYSLPTTSAILSTIVLQDDGKILTGGTFAYYTGISRNNIARLNSKTLSVSDFSNKEIVLYPNPVRNIVKFSKEISYGEIYSLDGRKVMSNIKGNSADVSKLERGTYIIKGIDKEGQSFSQKLIKQ